MVKVPLAIVGCGRMGGRHLLGLKELYDSEMCNVELVAVCDLKAEHATHLADVAADLLGRRPLVFGDLGEMTRAISDLQAVDITTEAGVHHRVATEAFGLGLNVLSEKPLGITMRACNLMLEAQRASGKLLSVAENYRRDPMSRLTKALLDVEVIGRPYLILEMSASGGNRILATPWRHWKNMGGMVLDMGVHNADMMMYYMGDVRQVYAQTELWEPTRFKAPQEGPTTSFNVRWDSEIPESIQATMEDTMVAVLNFESGTMGHWLQCYAGHGEPFGHKAIYGSRGSLRPGGIRNGLPPVVSLDGADPLTGDALLDLVPDYVLDEITTTLFGGERPASYELPFPAIDRKLLALEYFEFADSVLAGHQPEVHGEVARRAVAICYAGCEASLLNRPVTIAEIESEATSVFEADINAHYGI